MKKLSTSAQAVLNAAKDAYWSWENMAPNEADVIAAAALRAVVQELKYFGITEKNILAIAAELETQ
jgi:hypothetical protein